MRPFQWIQATILRLPALLHLLAYFAWQVVLANLNVTRIALARRPPIHPGILGLPLRVRRPAEVAALANMITLTPGTTSVDVGEADGRIFIHTIDVRQPEAIAAVKDRFEDLILQVSQPGRSGAVAVRRGGEPA